MSTVFSVAQLVFAVGMGMLALSSSFSLVLGYRHYRAETRDRDLILAGSDAAAFAGITVALTFAPDMATGLVYASPAIAALAYLVLPLQSGHAEARIARNFMATRGRRSFR